MTYEIDSKVDIGKFFVAPGIEEGRVWIGKQDGEGGAISVSAIWKKSSESFTTKIFRREATAQSSAA